MVFIPIWLCFLPGVLLIAAGILALVFKPKAAGAASAEPVKVKRPVLAGVIMIISGTLMLAAYSDWVQTILYFGLGLSQPLSVWLSFLPGIVLIAAGILALVHKAKAAALGKAEA